MPDTIKEKPTKARHATGKKPAAEQAKERPSTEEAKKRPSTERAKKRSSTEEAEKRPSAERAIKRPAAEQAKKRPSADQAKKRPSAEQAKKRPARKARGGTGADLFMESVPAPKKPSGKKRSKRLKGVFGAVNACLAICIALIVALGVKQQNDYKNFLVMREAVDRQTFYDGTTVEGVDVSKMTLSNALDYWRERVEPRYADRTVTLDNGASVTAGQLGYASDYEAVLTAAWSAGRSGSLEKRYQMVTYRSANPVAYSVNRSDYSPGQVEDYARMIASTVDRPAVDAAIDSFDVESYAFVFKESATGVRLDTQALTRDIEQAIASGGGSVAMNLEEVQPQVTTADVSSHYGLIDYAVTNASASSKARLNNIKLAMSLLNGTRVAPGEVFSFNEAVGERTTARGFRKATAYSGGDVTEQVGGGVCQVSTTLFNAAVKADMEIVERHNHSLTVAYVDKGKDATVNWGSQDLRFKNTSPDDIYICCYLTDDKRVRFGIFGRLLPNGESITLDAVTTEVIKYETRYEPTPLLPHGEIYTAQNGRNGYKADAYKVRWDADGNQISRELLFKSSYKMKDEVIQYGV